MSVFGRRQQWWALKTELSVDQEKALLLWLNSTPAILLMLARRVTTEGAWMQVKQPQWIGMPVLDVRALPMETVEKLAHRYDGLGNQELQALAKLATDTVRADIDNALSAELGLPDFAPLRQLLSREPGLSGKGLSPKPGQSTLFTETEMVQEAITQLKLI